MVRRWRRSIVGKASNTADITLSSNLNAAGPVSVYGGAVNLNANINTSAGGVAGDVLIKATGDVSVAASKSITTNAGDVVLWSNSDASGAGAIALGSGATLQTGGGDITMAGGADDNGAPGGYARGVGVAGVSTTGSFTINSGGGDVLIDH